MYRPMLVFFLCVSSVSTAHSDREMSLKEMTEDSLRRTIELSDHVREADLRARDQLGSAEISQTPESARQNSSSHSTSNDNHK